MSEGPYFRNDKASFWEQKFYKQMILVKHIDRSKTQKSSISLLTEFQGPYGPLKNSSPCGGHARSARKASRFAQNNVDTHPECNNIYMQITSSKYKQITTRLR